MIHTSCSTHHHAYWILWSEHEFLPHPSLNSAFISVRSPDRFDQKEDCYSICNNFDLMAWHDIAARGRESCSEAPIQNKVGINDNRHGIKSIKAGETGEVARRWAFIRLKLKMTHLMWDLPFKCEEGKKKCVGIEISWYSRSGLHGLYKTNAMPDISYTPVKFVALYKWHVSAICCFSRQYLTFYFFSIKSLKDFPSHDCFLLSTYRQPLSIKMIKNHILW